MPRQPDFRQKLLYIEISQCIFDFETVRNAIPFKNKIKIVLRGLPCVAAVSVAFFGYEQEFLTRECREHEMFSLHSECAVCRPQLYTNQPA